MGEIISMVSGSCGERGLAFPGEVKQNAVVLRHCTLTALIFQSFLSIFAVILPAHRSVYTHRKLHSTLSVSPISMGNFSDRDPGPASQGFYCGK